MAHINTLLDDSRFLEFYLATKKSGYGSADQSVILADEGKCYNFADAQWPEWRYKDVYYGHNPFFGNEVIEEDIQISRHTRLWQPITQMSYDGYCSGTKEEAILVFVLLRKVLQQNMSTASP